MEDRMTDDRADAALKSLFAEAERPPMGDLAFVSAAMARVRADVARKREFANLGLGVAIAVVAGGVAFNAGDIFGAAIDVLAPYAASAPQISMGFVTLLIAGAAAGMGVLVAER